MKQILTNLYGKLRINLFKKSLEKFNAIDSKKLYNSIDELPVYYWKKIHETNEYKYLLRDVVELENSEQLENLWFKINDEYLNEFGLTKQFKQIQRKKNKIALLKAEFIIKDERVILNFINIEENELKQIYKGFSEQPTFRESMVYLEKKQGFKLDSKKITVADYYNYLRTFKNG